MSVYLRSLVFLVAGFGLNVAGFSAGSPLSALADLGVTLLLFTIGLKLDIRLLMRREVLVGASGYTLLSSLSVALVLTLLKVTTLLLVMQLDFSNALLLGFALSFPPRCWPSKPCKSVVNCSVPTADWPLGS
ncbi:hypothetical protein PCI56_23140 [Plesiomonas shigelloides subsp. oncorhynchi]|nr:hypothetical protein [Plesiomonas shigelloides]